MKNRNGFLLVGVMLVFLLLLIIVPVMVLWVQNDTKMSVKDQKSSAAFGLAEAAVDRGYWKVKGSTSTFSQVVNGGAIAGYNFDVTYKDIVGGSYRIKISSGPSTDQITILGEGRDLRNREVRAITAIYDNNTIPGAVLAGGAITTNDQSVIHWGPVLAMGDITVNSAGHFPRKLSRQVVKKGSAISFNYDTNGTDPPNTDSLEWWSNYNVPELPVFDFETMRASAAMTTSLDCQDVSTETYTTHSTFTGYDPTPDTCPGTASQGCSCTGATFGCGGYCSGSCSASSTHTPSPATCPKTSGGTKTCSCSTSGTFSCNGATASCLASGTCIHTYSPVPTSCSYPSGTETCACNGSGSFSCGSATCTGGCTANYSVSVTTATSYWGMKCCHSSVYGGAVTCDYPAPTVNPGRDGSCTDCKVCTFPGTALKDKNYTWFWDNNITVSTNTAAGIYCFNDIAVRGTVIARGNMAIYGSDSYPTAGGGPTLPVPVNAWREYQYTGLDTTSSCQYPGDIGKGKNAATYVLGSCNSSVDSGTGDDLGIWGFQYVGGNLTRSGSCDNYGAIWVGGDVNGTDNAMVFYDAKLKVPTLNVMLQRESWKETRPSAAAWP